MHRASLDVRKVQEKILMPTQSRSGTSTPGDYADARRRMSCFRPVLFFESPKLVTYVHVTTAAVFKSVSRKNFKTCSVHLLQVIIRPLEIVSSDGAVEITSLLKFSFQKIPLYTAELSLGLFVLLVSVSCFSLCKTSYTRNSAIPK